MEELLKKSIEEIILSFVGMNGVHMVLIAIAAVTTYVALGRILNALDD